MQNTPKTIEEKLLILLPLADAGNELTGKHLLKIKEALAEQDRISRESVISQIHKAPIWKLVPNTPRMIMCSDTELKDFLQTLTNKE